MIDEEIYILGMFYGAISSEDWILLSRLRKEIGDSLDSSIYIELATLLVDGGYDIKEEMNILSSCEIEALIPYYSNYYNKTTKERIGVFWGGFKWIQVQG